MKTKIKIKNEIKIKDNDKVEALTWHQRAIVGWSMLLIFSSFLSKDKDKDKDKDNDREKDKG